MHDSQDNMDTNGEYYIVRAHIHHSIKGKLPLNAEVYISNTSVMSKMLNLIADYT